MPRISKQFFLEVTVEQFLDACSLTELQEVQLLIDRKVEMKQESEQHEKPVYNALDQ